VIAPATWEKYDRLRAKGYSQAEACRKCGVSQPSAWRRESKVKAENEGVYAPAERSHRGKTGKSGETSGGGTNPARRANVPGHSPQHLGAIPREQLSPEALRALDDFGYFRRRYFGRKSTPWQEQAGHQVNDFLETKNKEFLVDNCPPGSGKSTLFTLDIPAWLTCKRRGLRGLMGSASQSLAERYLLRLRNALESPYIVRAESEEMEMDLAYDGEATLLADYGLFKPEGSVLWTAQAFIVSQLDDRPITEKEPTWSAYGLDTAFIGGRFDFCIWDDVTEDKFLTTAERIDKQRDRWDKVAEKRLEPGGLLVIQGQRLGPEDLYRHCLDKKVGSSTVMEHDGCCDAEPGKKYHHIVFKSHYEDRCTGEHDDVDYYPNGCLLDPYRLPWRELEAEMENGDGANFQTVYQQEDMDPKQALVDMFWIKGGTHPSTHEIFPGCWDNERSAWELPKLALPYVAYLTCDPSPTKMWGIQLWVYHPATNLRFLMALHRGKLRVDQFLDWDNASNSFKGLLQEWHEKSVIAGFPISTLIYEQNGAQRFFLATDAFRRWQQMTGVRVIGHETFATNKLDPKLGPQILSPLYRRGLVRIPGKGDASRMMSLKLVEEVTRYPQFRTDDLVMSQWFGEANLQHVYSREPKVRMTPTPTWLKDVPVG
jgi:hypothetical protein